MGLNIMKGNEDVEGAKLVSYSRLSKEEVV